MVYFVADLQIFSASNSSRGSYWHHISDVWDNFKSISFDRLNTRGYENLLSHRAIISYCLCVGEFGHEIYPRIYSLSTYIISKVLKRYDNSRSFLRYPTSWGSFVWYSRWLDFLLTESLFWPSHSRCPSLKQRSCRRWNHCLLPHYY